MKSYIIKLISHPVTHLNIISIGMIILIGSLHNHAHFTMSKDADGYVKQWCGSSDENKKICVRYGTNDEY